MSLTVRRIVNFVVIESPFSSEDIRRKGRKE